MFQTIILQTRILNIHESILYRLCDNLFCMCPSIRVRHHFHPLLMFSSTLRTTASCSTAFSSPIRRLANTIFALSSGPPPSAIAVIRISGEASEQALRQLSRKGTPLEPLRLFYTPIFDGEGRLLDRVMACFMKGPRTFTGEDSAELYVHGSRAVVQAVCETLAKMPGLEPARAGEFTRRAFSNGKMDSVQVEALSGLIHAETPAQLRLCHAQSRAGHHLQPTRQKLLELLARMEARIDFAEDLGDTDQPLEAEFGSTIDGIAVELRRMLRSARRGQLIRTGLSVALVGRPNVGKSSLINRLAERELAIVSAVSGTTRDCLEARLQLNGQLVNVVDTAGIRADAECPLEREGIRRARDRAAEANLLLLVLDAGKLLELLGEVGRTAEMKEEEEESRLSLLLPALLEEFDFDPKRQQLIVCLNKADLVEEEAERRRVEKALDPIGQHQLVWTCCLAENGLHPLIQAVGHRLTQHEDPSEEGGEVFLSLERHIQCLERASVELEETRAALAEWEDPAMAAFHLQRCADAVGEIAGTIVHEQVLDSLFSQFCIGK